MARWKESIIRYITYKRLCILYLCLLLFGSLLTIVCNIHLLQVLIPITKIKRVNQSENVKRPSEKYMEIVTVDNFDFWFMGFFNYQKAFKNLQEAISQA